MIKTETFILGEIETNCYIIADEETGFAAIIDPGFSSKEVNNRIKEIGDNNIKYILLTHGHYDHISALTELKFLTRAKVVIGEDEAEFLHNNKLNLSLYANTSPLEQNEADILLADGDTLKLGATTITFVKTAGHTRGSGCYIVGDSIFTGDTLFKEDIGRTDLPTGNQAEIAKSLKKIAQIEGNYKVYVGHGENSTLDYEKMNNKYLIYWASRA
ncbi:hydrolase [Clostridia bacterium]|nr:hydrolase [Clostridia bacterium]